jgi:hypothetical protein
VVVRAVRAFGVTLEELHNDSTTVTFEGDYAQAQGQVKKGRPTARITHGHNKDPGPGGSWWVRSEYAGAPRQQGTSTRGERHTVAANRAVEGSQGDSGASRRALADSEEASASHAPPGLGRATGGQVGRMCPLGDTRAEAGSR